MECNENIYRKKECHLCGDYAFEKYLGTSKVLDGGYTRVENFEKSGFGYVVINYWELDTVDRHLVQVHLCPDCARKLDHALYKTMDDIKKEKENKHD